MSRVAHLWLFLWSKPTDVWRYVTGRSQYALARGVLVIGVVWLTVQIARTTWGGLWTVLDAACVAVITWITLERLKEYRNREAMERRRPDGTLYAYGRSSPRRLEMSSVMATINTVMLATGNLTMMAWLLWWSAELIAAQPDGSGKTLKAFLKRAVKAIAGLPARLPRPSLPRLPQPAPRPFPV